MKLITQKFPYFITNYPYYIKIMIKFYVKMPVLITNIECFGFLTAVTH